MDEVDWIEMRQDFTFEDLMRQNIQHNQGNMSGTRKKCCARALLVFALTKVGEGIKNRRPL